ncbi:DUF4911 domain-containing protein [Geobacter sp. AOG1]|uniref:DUF4911 domain-containing protein n=1 Tax=Geobacter sp. AOG1 TaxID=1566346 RepID=UPI001CC4DEF0|nr:DUF4911 domain-containing protein [Geobacter sp. AOG1]GFE57710.1 hypothetical protein AOG1_15900 [Geobacter sp. AOG1]
MNTVIYPTITRYFRVSRRELVYLKFITEAYEGLLTVSTVDRTEGIVTISYPDCSARDAEQLLLALAGEIPLEEVAPPPAGAHPIVSADSTPLPHSR